jgi:biopolymer transport protein TolR
MAEEKEPPLSPSQRSKIRRMSQPHEHDPSEAGGELNIVPFLDIVMNVLMFVLATIPAVFTSTIVTEPPSLGGKGRVRPAEKPTLNLTMLIVNDGVSLKTGGTSIGPGCEPGGGITAPKQNGDYDWVTLKNCAKKLKDASPDFKDENTVAIAAEPGISYSVVIAGMDAVRESDNGEPLFDNVNFAVFK